MRVQKESKYNYPAMEYRDGEFKKADLAIGHFYLTNDNRILLYLGVDKEYGKFNFYQIAGCLTDEQLMHNEYYEKLRQCNSGDDNVNKYLHLVHHDIQIDSIKNMIEHIFEEPVESKDILQYKGVPRIVAEFQYVNKEKELNNWYLSDKNKESSLPTLISPGKEKPLSVYVSSKDLKPGHLYYTGSSWRSTYCYLGRDNNNNYCWAFVGNVEYFVKNPIKYEDIERTKTNKRVKPIEYATKDPDAYIMQEMQQFLDGTYCKDISNLDLQRDCDYEY